MENSYKRIAPKFALKEFKGSCEFYYNGWQSKGIGYIEKAKVQKNNEWIKDYKILYQKHMENVEPSLIELLQNLF